MGILLTFYVLSFLSLACHSDNDLKSSDVDELWKSTLNCFEITLSKDLLAM